MEADFLDWGKLLTSMQLEALQAILSAIPSIYTTEQCIAWQ